MTEAAQMAAKERRENLRLVNEVTQSILGYSGETNTLNRFKADCEEALSYVGDELQAELVAAIMRMKIKADIKEELPTRRYQTINELVTALKDLEKKSKTDLMLLGELSQMHQKEEESVRAFAKRIRNQINAIEDSYKPIAPVDAQRIRMELKNREIKAFRVGIKQIIGDNIEWADNLQESIERAIKRENDLLERNLVWNEQAINTRKSYKINICQLCRKEGHEANQCNNKRESLIECGFCGIKNHTEDQCRKKIVSQREQAPQIKKCQLCDRTGHEAKECRGRLICNKCGKRGHSEETCRGGLKTVSAIKCQLCNGQGHIAQLCPMLAPPSIPRSMCQLCNRSGHEARNCNTLRQPKPPDVVCQICETRGHHASICKKNSANQPAKTCGYCHQTGHSDNYCYKNPGAINVKECTYCHKKGHDYEGCYKRQYSERLKQKNGEMSLHDQTRRDQYNQNQQSSPQGMEYSHNQ